MIFTSLCIGIRYVDYSEINLSIHEEFLGFSALKAMNAACRNYESKNLERNQKIWAGNTETSGTRLRCFFLQWLERSEVCTVQQRISDIYTKAYLCFVRLIG